MNGRSELLDSVWTSQLYPEDILALRWTFRDREAINEVQRHLEDNEGISTDDENYKKMLGKLIELRVN